MMENAYFKSTLIEELYQRYGSSGRTKTWRFFLKKYAWVVIVGTAKILKRAIDLLASGSMLVVLSPLSLIVALMIKLTDRGPVLFCQTRVGLWSREFPFPKFRSMVTNDEKLKDGRLERNDHVDGITFKMKKDPHITWIGRIIRKFSIEELPQLWCLFKGDMSLVSQRPPVPREVSLYTLANRRRLDAIPGLTCIWQVSGQGDIAFPEQVELDVQYIHSQNLWFDILLLLKTISAVLFGKGAY